MHVKFTKGPRLVAASLRLHISTTLRYSLRAGIYRGLLSVLDPTLWKLSRGTQRSRGPPPLSHRRFALARCRFLVI